MPQATPKRYEGTRRAPTPCLARRFSVSPAPVGLLCGGFALGAFRRTSALRGLKLDGLKLDFELEAALDVVGPRVGVAVKPAGAGVAEGVKEGSRHSR